MVIGIMFSSVIRENLKEQLLTYCLAWLKKLKYNLSVTLIMIQSTNSLDSMQEKNSLINRSMEKFLVF